MSKVQYDGTIPKSKLLRRNRRIETRKKEKERKTYATQHYSHYYLVTEDCVTTYEKKTLPAQTKEIGHYEKVYTYSRDEVGNLLFDKDGKALKVFSGFKFIVDEVKVIPEHEYRAIVDRYWVPREKPLLKRWYATQKKFHKKQAAKALRRIKNDEAFAHTGNHYKRFYDIAWELD